MLNLRKLTNTLICKHILRQHERSNLLLFKFCNKPSTRQYCANKGTEPPDDDKKGTEPTEEVTNSDKVTSGSTPIGLDSKFIAFKDADAPILLDVYEEKIQLEHNTSYLDEEMDEFYGINLQRGMRGVFDIEHLVDLLKREKAEDIFVAQLPPQVRYVDHIVVVSGRSRRHMLAMVEIVRRVYKKKRWLTDSIPHIEGGKSNEWMALDLGNIALHIFSPDARVVYDLESLWSVGPKFDPLVNTPEDPLITLLNKHSISLNDLNNKGQLQ